MSLGFLRTSVVALRILALGALISLLCASYVPMQPKWRDLLSGFAAGLLLVLLVALFRAPAAEVQRMPHERGEDSQP